MKPARSGFSVAELLVALVLLALVLSMFLGTASGNQKVLRGMRERILVNEQLRDGEAALVTDIRGAALSTDTVRMFADTALEFFATVGSAVVCTTPSSQTVSLVPADLSNGLMLTSIPVSPDTGDLVSIYSKRDTLTGARSWLRFRITAVGTAQSSTACPVSSGFTMNADASKAAYRLTLNGSLAAVTAGAPVRLLRRGRYSLYRSSDGDWFLGYKRCNAVASGCGTVQPVSGPYLPYSSSAAGLRFRYFDAMGTAVQPARPLDIASVEITFRAEVSPQGRVSGRVVDSISVVATPRNAH